MAGCVENGKRRMMQAFPVGLGQWVLLACPLVTSSVRDRRTGLARHPEVAVRYALRTLGRRWLQLHDEIKVNTGHLKELTRAAAPELGNRQANASLYRIVIVRMRWQPATMAYVERQGSPSELPTSPFLITNCRQTSQLHP